MTKASNHLHDKHHTVHHASSQSHHSNTKKVSHSPNQHTLPHFHSHKSSIHTNNDSASTIFDRLKKITANQQHNKKQIREIVVEKITRVFQFQGKLGKDVIIGFNSLQRQAEKHTLAVIVIAKDTKESLLHMLIELAIIQKIPYLLLPSFSSMLKDAFQVRSCFCFGVPKESISNAQNDDNQEVKEKDEQGEDKETEERRLQDETSKAAALDELRDYLIQLAFTANTTPSTTN